MMIKQIIRNVFIIALVTASISGFAQNNRNFDARLADKFSETELHALSAEEVNYWNFVAEHGFVVFEIKKEKGDSEMELLDFSGDATSVNPFSLGLSPDETSVRTYRLGNSGYGIMVLSEKKLRAKMERLSK